MKKKVDWHRQGLIPALLYFQNGGNYTGSVNNKGMREFRYKIGAADGKIRTETWFGPFCYEKSRITGKADFPMDEEGRNSAIRWIGEQYEQMIP